MAWWVIDTVVYPRVFCKACLLMTGLLHAMKTRIKLKAGSRSLMTDLSLALPCNCFQLTRLNYQRCIEFTALGAIVYYLPKLSCYHTEDTHNIFSILKYIYFPFIWKDIWDNITSLIKGYSEFICIHLINVFVSVYTLGLTSRDNLRCLLLTCLTFIQLCIHPSLVGTLFYSCLWKSSIKNLNMNRENEHATNSYCEEVKWFCKAYKHLFC